MELSPFIFLNVFNKLLITWTDVIKSYQQNEFILFKALFNIYVPGCLVKHLFLHLGCHLHNNQTPLREYSQNIQGWWATPDEAASIDTCPTRQLGTVGPLVLSISVIREELVSSLMFTLIQASQLDSAMCSAPNALMFPT